MPTQRLPTSWTRPLQLAVIAYAAASALFALTIPLWMNSVGHGTALIAGLVGCAMFVLVIVGAANRLTWLFDAVWALLGLAAVVTVFDLFRGTFSLTYGSLLPEWAGWVRLIQTAVGAGLAAAMLYARNQRGQWAMSEVSPRTVQRSFQLAGIQREVVETDLERTLAIAFCAWLRRIESSDPPPELWPTPAELIVVARVRAQLEHELASKAGNPHLTLVRHNALVLGEWLGRDAVLEPSLPPYDGAYSPEQHALWRLEAWLEHELFADYSDHDFKDILEAARERVISSERQPPG